ncbi:hypothetical protein D3Y57_11260 [Sphingomonas paeninsulae]|uniref:Lipoprotein n=1 Tax=Sphingomonas paeninsulae TaxID=2319844 RepID=A0A494TQ63_SPHPE|nr:hypothetical protein [Sphingomonas paeninsulae]AYJ87926.1 hypothetical protein D3Y57_11260 [Sphingomonas paeninsulae]
MTSIRTTLVRAPFVLVPLVLAGCVGKPVAPPARAPAPIVRPAPTPPAPPVANWENGLLTPGRWTYTRDSRGGLALYGIAGSNAVLSIRCDTTARRVFISRMGSVAGSMTLRATSGARAYAARPTAGTVPYVAADLTPTDPQLDALAFSRGRFLVGLSGAVDVVVPSWPEVARVIEDCRG